ncbi:MAG: hypothetical protein HUK24_09380 [Sphaerochaetaceae bacterium]|nr:hypothetical protein [Sphaerochaetaceae bacterium]
MNQKVRIVSYNLRDIDEKMAYIFMGNRNSEPSAELEAVVTKVKKELLETLSCKIAFEEVPFYEKENRCNFGSLSIVSKALSSHLKNCDKVVLFAATIGSGCDVYRKKALVRSSIEGLVADALGSAAIETLCDKFCDDLKNMDYETKSRFSPGYGDLELGFQKVLVEYLDCKRLIGLSLTDSLLMVPQKSVTAIVGLRRKEK